ncbi:MAG: hypothetical protein GY716_17105 [bacterium]|nr:hypothetical protein [bacterium]
MSERTNIVRRLLGAARRALREPFVVVALWFLPVALALPGAWIVTDSIESSVERSLARDNLRNGIDVEWLGEYQDEARALSRTFEFTVNGAGAFLRNLEGWLDGGIAKQFPGLLALGVFFVLIWALLYGGLLDRLVTADGKRGATRFLESGARYWFRFVRLAVLSAGIYFLVYKLHHRVFDRLAEMTRDVTSETTVLLYSLLVYAATALLLTTVRTCFSYAKIATVAESRRSMLLAALRGVTFVARHPLRTMGLYYLTLVVGALMLLVYSWVAPAGTESTPVTVLVGFGIGQAFLFSRTFLRVVLAAGESRLYLDLRMRPAPATPQPATPPVATDPLPSSPPATQ